MAALVLAQGLGVVHRVAHGLGSGAAHAAAAAHAGDHPWDLLFGAHDQPGDCSGYDQLSHGDALPVAVLALPGLPPLAAPAAAVPANLWLAQRYSRPARGPPA